MNQAFHKDIMEYTQFPQYDIIWTDPPWEDKMVKFFQTLNKKQTGKSVNHNIAELVHQLFKLANPNKPLVVEYSIAGSEFILDVAKQYGHTLFQSIDAIQDNNLPSKIFTFNTNVVLQNGLKGYKNTIEGVKALNAKVVFDPFAGIGRTGKAVIDAGANYIGSEFNQSRYNKLCLAILK